MCQDLLTSEKLRDKEGYKEVLRALQKIEKVNVLKKTEAFDHFFDKTFRRRGQSIDQFLRDRAESWSDLLELAEGVAMSDDLLAYFLLKNVNLTKEEKRQVLLANQSDYSLSGFEKALRVSFFDIHEREKSRDWQPSGRPKGGKGAPRRHYANAAEEESADDEYDPDSYDQEPDEFYANAADDEPEAEDPTEPSDVGASGDDEVYEAYASYKDSRKRLKDLQKSRGFHKPKPAGQSNDERRAAIEKEKARSRCAACGRIGHWAGDSSCSKGSGQKGSKGGKPGKGKNGKGRGNKGKAYFVGEEPLFFSLRDSGNDGYCNMVFGDPTSSEDEEAKAMPQDSGDTELDARRKTAVTYAGDGWEYMPPFAAETPDPDYNDGLPKATAVPEGGHTEKVTLTVPKEQISEIIVADFAQVIPANFGSMKVRELQSECHRWGIQTSGKKDDLKARLDEFFSGQAVLKKGCTTKFFRLRAMGESISSTTTASAAASGHSPEGRAPRTRNEGLYKPSQDSPCRIFRSSGFEERARDAGYAAKPTTSTTSPTRPATTVGRSPTAEERHPGPRFDASGNQWDPKTGVQIPRAIRLNEVVPEVPCGLCGHSMVLRRGFNLFFGCSTYSKCQYTRELREGLAIYGRARNSSQ